MGVRQGGEEPVTGGAVTATGRLRDAPACLSTRGQALAQGRSQPVWWASLTGG